MKIFLEKTAFYLTKKDLSYIIVMIFSIVKGGVSL